MRLDKFIAQATHYSRSEVKKLIRLNAITVNDLAADNSGINIHPEQDQISLYGKPVLAQQARYFMLYKPQGFVCANRDSEHPTVMDLLNETKQHKLQIAGRLDKDTTGLVLLTDDGQWNHRLTAPSHNCQKIYKVTVTEPLPKAAIEIFKQGILLKNETKPTRPATLTILDDFHAELAITEGKYHQVKRMFAALNNHVSELHRQSIGPIALDKQLTPGQYRPLTLKEINYFAN